MQINVCVPKQKAPLIEALDEAARRTGRQKNEIALEAIEAYLGQTPSALGTFDLGQMTIASRAGLDLERGEQ